MKKQGHVMMKKDLMQRDLTKKDLIKRVLIETGSTKMDMIV